jgi:hypothetical protein
MKDIRVYFTENNKNYYIDDDSDNIMYEEVINKKDLDNFNYFHLFKGYSQSLEGLQEFYRDLMKWSSELLNEGIDYTKYSSHNYAVYLNLLRFSTNDIKKNIVNGINGIEDINGTECFYYEKCPNSGLISIDDTIVNKELEFFGKDFSAYYANMLANNELKMPIRRGTQAKITDFKKQLKFGIYKCSIQCNDKNFKKIFMFSKDGYYTHYSINFCLKHKKQFNIDIQLLDTEKDYNCYVYDNKDLINTKLIFGNWFQKLSLVKIKYPKNKLIKHLLSSLWGALIQWNRTIIKDDEEFMSMDVSLLSENIKSEYKLLDTYEYVDDNFNICSNYEVLKWEQPYKYQFRIKPFLTSFARKYIAEFLINNVDLNDIIRIQTDGFSMTKNYDFTHLQYYPKDDAEKTGKMIWYNVNFNNKNSVR